jgi:hypothetical protein
LTLVCFLGHRSLATVPDLVDICIKHIVSNFEGKCALNVQEYFLCTRIINYSTVYLLGNPLLDELKPRHKSKVLKMLATNISLKVTAPLIEDEGYWQRCCKARWQVCDVSKHGSSWKQMFFERNLQGLIENFVPESTDPKELDSTLSLSAAFVKCLNIQQLLLPIHDATTKDDDASDTTSDVGASGLCCDHLDLTLIFRKLPHLEEVHITYGVRNCGMNFDWSLFKFTERDCSLLAKVVERY